VKNTTGTKNYNGIDWFWPHDFRHYLRDANSRQRKLVHNGWLKIGVPVKKTGLKISDRYLQPKKNQMKKAWYIVRKVVAPKELGQPIPESTNEGFADKLAKKMKKHKGTNVKSKKKVKLKGRWVYQDYDGLKEAGNEATSPHLNLKNPWYKMNIPNRAEDNYDNLEHLLLKKAKLTPQKANDFIVSVIDAIDNPKSKYHGNHTSIKADVWYNIGKRNRFRPIKEGLDEATYQLPKRYTATNIDELDAALNRAGINGIPDFTKKTWTTMHDKVNHSKLKKFMKRIGAKKIKEGSCGYGVDGKLGKEPAGPHLLKKKKKKVDEIIKLKDILLENPANYVDKDIDNIELFRRKKKHDSNSVNENKDATDIYNNFEIVLRDFEKEFLSLSAQAGRASGDKSDEKILRKELSKRISPLYSMIRSWGRSNVHRKYRRGR